MFSDFQNDLFGRQSYAPVRKTVSPGDSSPRSVAEKTSRSLDLIPMVTIHPDRVCVYKDVRWSPSRPQKMVENAAGELVSANTLRIINSERKANGGISVNARRKIMKALDYLLLLANNKVVHTRYVGRQFNFKIAFVTLTLPSTQIHDDKVIIRKCLNSFLIEMKRFYHVNNYLWRAEKQKNGNIHFHLVIDKFIPWSELRDRWNRIVNKLGYVDRYRDEMKRWHSGGFRVRAELLDKWDYKKQVKAYKSGMANDWNSPNSTDIHSVRRINNVKAYVSKYMTKEPGVDGRTGEIVAENIPQNGRVWGCNRELSNCPGGRLVVDWEVSDEMEKACRESQCHSYRGDYFSVYFIDFTDLKRFGATTLYKEFCSFLLEHFGYSFQDFIA
jgi:hypothetical protein